MEELAKIKRWLEAGKQIGKTVAFEKQGEICWLSVAVQKVDGFYLVYFNEIKDTQMANHEDYLTERWMKITHLNQLAQLLASTTRIRVSDLEPCKGQRIFNPALSEL